MSAYKLLGLFLCLVITATALPTQDEPRTNAVQTENDLLDSIYTDCLRKDSMSCLKYKIFNFVDKMLGQKDTITVTEGVQIVKTGGEKDGAPRAITSEDTIESLILSRFADFLDTHTIKVDLKGSEIVKAVSSTARSLNDVAESLEEENDVGIEESRGKKKKGGGKIGGALLAAMAFKAAILGKLALAAIALIAGKALLIGKIALVLSAIIGLKKLLGSQGKHVTYEVVPHAQHTSSHVTSHEAVSAHGGYGGGDIGGGYSSGGGSGGWGRSLDAQKMAYRGHTQAQQA